jgi:hypothetical protein
VKGYAVDAVGRLVAFGGAPDRLPGRVWDGVGIMRRIAVLRDGSGGYVMDCWGGVFPFGDAPRLRCHGLWPGADVARDLALSRDDRWGFLLDADGGLHRLGLGPWAQHDRCVGKVGRAVAVALCGDGESGYVLGRDGIVQAFNEAPETGLQGDPQASPAVDLTLLDDDRAGLVLRSDGSLVPFGGAAPAQVKIGRTDRAVAVDALPSGAGYVLTAKGHLLPFGGALPLERFPTGEYPIVDFALLGRPVRPPLRTLTGSAATAPASPAPVAAGSSVLPDRV